MDWTAEGISELATGYWRSQALVVASQAGLFDGLPGTAAEVCANAGVDLRVGGMVLESLAAMGLVDLAAERYSIPAGQAALLREMRGALALNAAMYGLWGKLGEMLKTGAPVVAGGGHLGGDPIRTREFVMGMHGRGLALLPKVVGALDLAGASSVLDVGSGAGTLGRMIAEAHSNVCVTLADLPGVTAVARTLTNGHPTAGRVTHVELDYLREPIPRGHDLIVHCGALHQHSRDAARALVDRLAAELPAGGRLFVVDLFADDGRRGPAFSLLFGLNMALVSPVSRVHSLAEVVGYLRAVGLVNVSAQQIEGSLYGIVSGRRG